MKHGTKIRKMVRKDVLQLARWLDANRERFAKEDATYVGIAEQAIAQLGFHVPVGAVKGLFMDLGLAPLQKSKVNASKARLLMRLDNCERVLRKLCVALEMPCEELDRND